MNNKCKFSFSVLEYKTIREYRAIYYNIKCTDPKEFQSFFDSDREKRGNREGKRAQRLLPDNPEQSNVEYRYGRERLFSAWLC